MVSEIWAIIVSTIVVLVIYGYVSSKLAARKKARLRQETVPAISESLKVGIAYDVHLSDGRKFENVELIGSVENDDDAFSFAGYEGLVVLKQVSGKKIFLKKLSIRYIAEI